jgi:O-antigen ligase
VAYFYARINIKANFSFWKNLSYIFSAMVIFECLLGFLQFAAKSPLGKNIEYQVNIEYFGSAVDETPFTFRPVGTFDHANTLGIWVSSVCVFLLGIGLKNKLNILRLSFLAGSTLMIITISRSAWLGFAVGFLFVIIYTAKKSKNLLKPLWVFALKWRFIIFPILLLLFLFFVFPRAENSIYSFQQDAGAAFYRRIQIQDAVQIIELHPILGIGALMSVYEGISLNLYTVAASVPLQVHNWYLQIALENGLLAIFVFIFFLTLSIKRIFEFRGKSIISISVLGFIISSLIAATLQPYINIEFLILLLSLTNDGRIVLSNEKNNS